jgi:hypothetical protein
MLTQESIYSFHDMNPVNKTVSITKVTIVKNDGIEIARSSNTRAFQPGDIEAVKEYIGVSESPEITYLESIWTQEAIDAWRGLEG